MANKTIQNNDSSNVVLRDDLHQPDIIAFVGADDLLAGTILARTTATGKLGIYDPGGAGGLGVPVAVLTYDVSAAGAGDVAVRVLISGVVDKSKLIIDNGDPFTQAIYDQLRSLTIIPQDVTQTTAVDNPQP